MKKCDCGFSTLDDSFDFCYRCGKKLRPVAVEPAFQEENTEAAAFKCADCGHTEELYTPFCPKCGGEIVALADKNIGVAPPVFEGERGKIKRCSNCDYSTNNLTYERCPVCSCPLAEAEGFPKDIQLSVTETDAGARMSNFGEKEGKYKKHGVLAAPKQQNRKAAAASSGKQGGGNIAAAVTQSARAVKNETLTDENAAAETLNTQSGTVDAAAGAAEVKKNKTKKNNNANVTQNGETNETASSDETQSQWYGLSAENTKK